MVKSEKETNKIAGMLLEQYGLKEEMDSMSHFIIKSKNGFMYLSNGEIITREELTRRTKRKLDILQFVLEKAKKTTLIEGKITLTEED